MAKKNSFLTNFLSTSLNSALIIGAMVLYQGDFNALQAADGALDQNAAMATVITTAAKSEVFQETYALAQVEAEKIMSQATGETIYLNDLLDF